MSSNSVTVFWSLNGPPKNCVDRTDVAVTRAKLVSASTFPEVLKYLQDAQLVVGLDFLVKLALSFIVHRVSCIVNHASSILLLEGSVPFDYRLADRIDSICEEQEYYKNIKQATQLASKQPSTQVTYDSHDQR